MINSDSTLEASSTTKIKRSFETFWNVECNVPYSNAILSLTYFLSQTGLDRPGLRVEDGKERAYSCLAWNLLSQRSRILESHVSGVIITFDLLRGVGKANFILYALGNYFLLHYLAFLFLKILLLSKTLLVFLPMWGKLIPSVDFYRQHKGTFPFLCGS